MYLIYIESTTAISLSIVVIIVVCAALIISAAVFTIIILSVCIIRSKLKSSSSKDITPTADPIYEIPGENRLEHFAMTALESEVPDVMTKNSAYNIVGIKR